MHLQTKSEKVLQQVGTVADDGRGNDAGDTSGRERVRERERERRFLQEGSGGGKLWGNCILEACEYRSSYNVSFALSKTLIHVTDDTNIRKHEPFLRLE